MDGENSEETLRLPEGMMEEIIIRLPVKSMLRFKCLTKQWFSIISSKRFIKTHLCFQNSRKSNDLSHLSAIVSHYNELHKFSVPSLLKEQDYFRADDPITTFITPQRGPNYFPLARIVGCCNGLVLFDFWDIGERFFLWNPSTKIMKELPELDDSYGNSTFSVGWDDDGSYKIGGVANGKLWILYSSETNSWETVEHHPESYLEEYGGQFVRGKFHWFMENHPYLVNEYDAIVTLDLKSELFGRIELPATRLHERPNALGEIRGCLCIITSLDDGLLDIWIMKEYGVKDSWGKLTTISQVEEIPKPPFSVQVVLGSSRKVMTASGSTFLVFDRGGNVFRYPQGVEYHFNPHLCIESLISPFDV